jgi:3-oxoacyl-[acyl-carrier protein] reductase
MAAEHAPSYTPPSLRDVAPENILKAVYALGRRAEPSKIAAIASFLLSADASYITGATIDASGGRM